ncbi:proteasome activator complex subunit 1 isoform X2 [Dromaius novaehollandiae]|uniref:proteasome activator complex subunit 1 isoform X2 n=1 Tax=Dromaius novaehollandiae TaxID=8790 RepID=UPI00312041F6
MAAPQVEAFRTQLCAQVEGLLAGGFPAKVAELQALLQDPAFAVGPEQLRSELDIPLPDPAQKKKKKDDDEDDTPPCGPLSPNAAVLGLLRRMRPLVQAAREHLAQVSAWLQLQVPRIEDGDNFGVAVQEKVFELFTASRTKLDGFQGRLAKYLLERGDAVAKAAKNPHVMDYRELVHALDQAEFGELLLTAAELRDLYAVLHDVVVKNMEKIRKPRGEAKGMIY